MNDTLPPSRSMSTNELLAPLQDSILNEPHYISGMLQLPSSSFSFFYRVTKDGHASRCEDSDLLGTQRESHSRLIVDISTLRMLLSTSWSNSPRPVNPPLSAWSRKARQMSPIVIKWTLNAMLRRCRLIKPAWGSSSGTTSSKAPRQVSPSRT